MVRIQVRVISYSGDLITLSGVLDHRFFYNATGRGRPKAACRDLWKADIPGGGTWRHRASQLKEGYSRSSGLVTCRVTSNT